MIFVIATLEIIDENRSAVLEASRDLVDATRKEAGCMSYDLHQSVSDPNVLVFVERWQDRQVLEAHFHSPHLSARRHIQCKIQDQAFCRR